MSQLAGVRVVEFAALGPLEFAGMQLADLGAEVTRVRRPGDDGDDRGLLRGRRQVTLDLKSPAGIEDAKALLAEADVLLEGMRPGVMERLGLGPADVAAINPRIVYGRMTGWGQTGPLAARAGHDIDYIAVAGALGTIRQGDDAPPVIPGNMLGDNAGAAYLVSGVITALFARDRPGGSGVGQVIDAAIVDSTAQLLETVRTFEARGDRLGLAMLQGTLPWYGVYRCADGRFLAVGAVEPAFYAQLLTGLRLPDAPDRDDPANWPALRQLFTEVIAGRRRDEWTAVFAGTDACVAPVLDLDEALHDPHLAARGTWRPAGSGVSSAPAPRFLPLPTTGD